MRLRTVSCQTPGWHRMRRGRGFSYVDTTGRSLPRRHVERIRELAIPAAWTDVWICPDERGHLQAVGTDDAGRRQYLYHAEWRRKRDAAKFDRAIELGKRLPRVRATLHRELGADPSERSTVLAAAIRLIDLGCFRPGAENYAQDNGSYGLTTLQMRHVRRTGSARTFRFVGKGGVDHEVIVTDREVIAVVDALRRNRRPDQRLLVSRVKGRLVTVDAAEINRRIRELFGLDATAKDLRTWKATVIAAAELAAEERASSSSRRSGQVRHAVAAAAELLGNTPAVARASYVDPRVIDLFEDGRTMGRARSENGLDRAVVRLLTD